MATETSPLKKREHILREIECDGSASGRDGEQQYREKKPKQMPTNFVLFAPHGELTE
jgi:hypothetical protein